MNGYGIAALILVAIIVTGVAIAVVAGSFAVIRHPARDDAARNASRYVKPAFAGVFMVLGGLVGLVLLAVVGAIDTLT